MLTRNVHARLFAGTLSSEVEAGISSVRAGIFDRLTMPALALDSGKAISHEFENVANTSNTLVLPADYDTAKQLYVAIRTTENLRIAITSPSFVGTKVVLLKATTGTTFGEHAGIFVWQGRITTIAVSVALGAAAADVSAFIYEIPDLDSSASYVDQELALGFYTA